MRPDQAVGTDPTIKKGAILDIRVEKFADRGMALSRVAGYVIMVQGAVPGDLVRVRVARRKRKYAEARVLELLEASPLRIEPRCRYFGSCGGCRWQNVSYETQLEAKHDSVCGAFEHVAGLEATVAPVIGSDKQYLYRNKMEFSFSTRRWLTREEIDTGEKFDSSFALGLHVPRSFARVIDLHECHLQSSLSERLVNAIRDLSISEEWTAWDVKTHKGYLRHLVIRQSAGTADVMVNLVTNGRDEERIARATTRLRADFPEVTTFVNTVHTGLAQTAHGEAAHVVYGTGSIRERLGPFEFEIGPESFFQTNTAQAERLYEETCRLARLTSSDVAYDLYCGTGTISLFLAGHVQRVVGMESVGEAVYAARQSAERNGVDNCTFARGLVERDMNAGFVRKHGTPDIVVVDPPRPGLHPKVTKAIAEMQPERFVYVSCNPRSQARDLGLLADQYQIDALQPVDLFPQTDHVECIAALSTR